MHKRYVRNFINGTKFRIWRNTAHVKLVKTENNTFDITFSQTEEKLSKK